MVLGGDGNNFIKLGTGRCSHDNANANFINHALSASSKQRQIKQKPLEWCKQACIDDARCTMLSHAVAKNKAPSFCFLWMGESCPELGNGLSGYITFAKNSLA